MPRAPRLLLPGAWYHVMNRGANHQASFLDQSDYEGFLRLLVECSKQWALEVHAYCLMPNHYHLLVRTPGANLDRSMRHLDGVFTQRFNRRHGRDGPLFRGRYRTVLVGENDYLLQLVRYIHRNPVDAENKLCDRPEDYLWSSCPYLLDPERAHPFLRRSFVLGLFGDNQPIERLREFISSPTDTATEEFYSAEHTPPAFGSPKFCQRIQPNEDFEVDVQAEEPIQITEILDAVGAEFGLDRASLIRPGRSYSGARSCAAHLCRVSGHRIEAIGSALGGISGAAVSKLCRSFRRSGADSVSDERLQRIRARLRESKVAKVKT